MKKLMASFLVIVMILSLSSASLASSFTEFDITMTDSIGCSKDEMLSNDSMRSLVVFALGVDVMEANIHTQLSSDLDFNNAYTGEFEDAVVSVIPTVDRDECLVIVFVPGDSYGLYEILYSDFTGTALVQFVRGIVNNYKKIDPQTLNNTIERLLNVL